MGKYSLRSMQKNFNYFKGLGGNTLRNFFAKKQEFNPAVAFISQKNGYLDQPKAQFGNAYGYRYKPNPSYTEIFDGEKNFGQLGFPLNYKADHRNLSIRSWQAYYDSDITQIVINNYLMWCVGSGLSLQSQPIERLINRHETNFNRDDFVSDVEMFWKIYANSEYASHNDMQDLHQLAWEAKLNAIVGGDVLCIERFDGKNVSIQLVDGLHISTPSLSSFELEAKKRGNEIRDGVEIDNTGKHIAFYIREKFGKYKRILARHSKTGRKMAWLVYGTKYRLNDTRGMPLFSCVLEEMTKLNRYKEATVSAAEQRANIVLTIEHDSDSTEENPFEEQMKRSGRSGINDDNVPETQRYEGDEAAQKIAMTTPNQVVNMPKGSKLVVPKSDMEISFKEFFETNFDVLCATLGIPPEVALAKYNSNYSASRMAVKTWEHKMRVIRNNFVKQFYKPIFNFWLDMEIMKDNIIASGYVSARMSRNMQLKYAYLNCEFYGVNMPHVDPLKEVTAERKKLGDEKTPLTSRTKATRNLNEGEWDQNIEAFKKENDMLNDMDMMPEVQQENNQNNNQNE